MIMMVMSLVGSFISGPVSDLIGRRKVPVVVASVLFAVGIAMPWIFKSTMGMYLFAGIAGLGYAVYSAVDQALLVDVLPNKEEAGKDLGILNMATTLGQMCGPVVMSAIVVNLGYNFAFPTSIALAIIGCFFIMAIKTPHSDTVGSITMGFGILFTGLLSMTAAVSPLSESETFANMFYQLSGKPVLGFLLGAGVAFLLQSSSATIGILQAIATTGALTFSSVYAIIIGVNIGDCVTSAPSARRPMPSVRA